MTSSETHTRRSIVVNLSGISKEFLSDQGHVVQALGEVDLTIHQGQLVTMVGSTGCGKTTLLNIVAGLEKADSGTVTLGSDMHLGRNMGYVFQHYTLFPWRTTLHNVEFGLQMRGTARGRRRAQAQELLAKVGLADFEKACPHELSGGMRQRAAIAQALALRPKLLLMDEPFGAVDDRTRAELQQILIELWRTEHMTILFVTHNIDEAISLGSRVIVVGERPGRIIGQFDIDFPQPRDLNAPRFTNLLIEIRRSIGAEFAEVTDHTDD
jgi:sulfonate transport system ATP-binding protein